MWDPNERIKYGKTLLQSSSRMNTKTEIESHILKEELLLALRPMKDLEPDEVHMEIIK